MRRRARPSELSTLVPRDCGLVWAFVRRHGLKAGRHVAVYLNANIDVEIGVELADTFVSDGEVVRSSTPEGPVVTATHFGPYHGLGATHDAIHQWSSSEGHTLTGCRWEIYGHWQQEWDTNPAAIRTDIFYQLTPAS